MKTTIKKILVTVLALVMSMSLLAGCGSQKTISVLQLTSHPSLDNIYTGIQQGLKEGLGDKFDDYKIDFKNSNGDMSANLANANAIAAMSPVISVAIATPSAMEVANAAQEKFPVVYSAVSDPYSCGLADAPNVTGTCDMLDYEGQLDLIEAFFPDVKTIGVMRSLQEQNSESQVATLIERAKARGIKVIVKEVTNANEISAACDALLQEDIDCMTNVTDNTIVDYLDVIIEKTNAKGIAVFGSEIEQVKNGCIASASLDYVALGKTTGLMMAQILKGEKTADDLGVVEIDDSFDCYNSSVAKALGVAVPSVEMQDVA